MDVLHDLEACCTDILKPLGPGRSDQLQQVEVGDEVLRAAESLWKRGLLVAGG